MGVSATSPRASSVPPTRPSRRGSRCARRADRKYIRLKGLMREWNLHSVCEEAHCPNIGECWEDSTATFMILGDVCTRNCGYCAVTHGRPVWEDREEPERVGRAVGELGLEHVVITSVNRDDLADGGAAHFAATVRAIRRHAPGCRVELLIPDFQGNAAALETVIDGRARRPEPQHRDGAAALQGGAPRRPLRAHARAVPPRAARPRPASLTKSGIILGLGEERDELLATMRDLRGGRREHPDARPVPAAVGPAPAGGALLPPGRVRGAGRGRPRAWASPTSSRARWSAPPITPSARSEAALSRVESSDHGLRPDPDGVRGRPRWWRARCSASRC